MAFPNKKKMKANTWQACYSRHRWCARVLFPFLLWEVLEIEKWKKRGKRRTKQILFENNFQNEATLVMENKKSKHLASLLQPPPLMCACSFSISSVRSARIWKMIKTGKKAHQTNTFQKRFSERGHSRNEKWKSEHVASLLQPPPLMCACSLSISLVGSARNVKKVFFSKIVLAQHSRPHPRKMKANTWQACYSRHRWCARVLYRFLWWEVLEM